MVEVREMSFFTNFIKKFTGKTVYVSGGGTRSRPKNIMLEEQETCNAIIDCIATHVSRGQILHVIKDENDQIKEIKRNSAYSKIFNHPNPMMTRQDFLYALTWNLVATNTAFAWIKWGRNMVPLEIWPLVYLDFQILQNPSGEYLVQISDPDGQRYTVDIKDLVCVRRKYDGKGYASKGNGPVNEALNLTGDLDESLKDAITISNKIHGILHLKNSMLTLNPANQNSKSFQERMKDAADTGSLVIDGTEEYDPVNFSAWSANFKQSEQVFQRLYTYFRTPMEVVNGTASEQTMQNWYDSITEVIWEEYGEAFTSAMFTGREQDFGNQMAVYSSDITGASWNTKLQILLNTKDIGLLTKNEQRQLLRMPPVDDGDESYVSLNYVKSTDMTKYQTGQDDTDKPAPTTKEPDKTDKTNEGSEKNAGNK